MALEGNETPFLTCIVCAFNEGDAITISLESLLAQSFTDFEVLVIDDGADEATRSAFSKFDDPRIQIVRQANDGLSAARNRGLSLARGEYVCFLDGDDSRPVWAFKSVAALLKAHRPDAVFCAGVLSELRGEIQPFYDSEIIETLVGRTNSEFIRATNPKFRELLPLLMLLEPQAANKFVSKALIDRVALTFPNGHFFEDMLFHCALVASIQSFCILPSPTFTYFRRYGRGQITATSSDTRLDSIAVAKITLECFAQSARFSNVLLRGALLAATFRLMRWCHDCTSHVHRYQFHEAMVYLVETLDERYFWALPEFERSGLPYAGVMPYIEQLRQEACARAAS